MSKRDYDIKCITYDDYILLQRDIEMISGMYVDLHKIVDEQQEKIDHVEECVEQTKLYTDMSEKELDNANVMNYTTKIMYMTLVTGVSAGVGWVIGYPICVILGTQPVIGLLVGGLTGMFLAVTESI